MKGAFVLVVTSILFFACTGPTVAQEIPLTPEMKKWEPILGKWQSEAKFRDGPEGVWQESSGTVESRSGGFFLEVHWKGVFGGQDNSSIEMVGYDPIQRTYVSSFFESNGRLGRVTSMGFIGTTVNVNWTAVTAERETQVGRVTWEYSSDFRSSTGTVEQFTDGKWWTSGEIKSTKVE